MGAPVKELGDSGGAGGAVLSLFLEEPMHQERHRRRQRDHRRQLRGLVVDDHVHEQHVALALEGPPPGEDLERRDAEGVEIDGGVAGLKVQLLWRHIGELALQRADGRQRGVVLSFGDAEVQELRLPLGREHDVVRRDVAMHEAHRPAVVVDGFVDGGEGAGGVAQDASRDGQGDRAVCPEQFSQRWAIDMLQEEPRLAHHVDEVHHGDDVWMVQLGEDRRLALEHVEGFGACRKVGAEAFGDDGARERAGTPQLRQKDLGHPTAAQPLSQAKTIADHEWQGMECAVDEDAVVHAHNTSRLWRSSGGPQ